MSKAIIAIDPGAGDHQGIQALEQAGTIMTDHPGMMKFGYAPELIMDRQEQTIFRCYRCKARRVRRRKCRYREPEQGREDREAGSPEFAHQVCWIRG